MNYIEQHERHRIQQEAEDLRVGVAPYRCAECKHINMLRIDHSVVFFCRACHCCVLEKVREYKETGQGDGAASAPYIPAI